MSKAIFILDKMPERCGDCIFREEASDGMSGCRASKYLILHKKSETKPSWCPLKELPEQKQPSLESMEHHAFDQGWNYCLDRIENGRERGAE